ncbi:MAG: hypothetical protein LBS29_02365 [Endomicrobium sp.]|nr:hypothetical protein [Endomicrobium sp.]
MSEDGNARVSFKKGDFERESLISFKFSKVIATLSAILDVVVSAFVITVFFEFVSR